MKALACADAAAHIAVMRLMTKRSRSHNKRTNPIADYERLLARWIMQCGRTQIIHSGACLVPHDWQIMSPAIHYSKRSAKFGTLTRESFYCA